MGKKVFLKSLLCITAASCIMWGKYGNSMVSAAENVNATEETAAYKQLDMPIITIDTEDDKKISSDEEYVNAKTNVVNDNGDYDMQDMDVSIRLRGNSSLYAAKSSYKLKFNDKQNVLNLGDGKGKTWDLIANYYDVSLLRNLTTYHFADLLTGMSYSPNCRSVEVYVNGEYQGVYLLCEAVNVSKSRVNIAEKIDEVESNGYLVEMSRYTTESSFQLDTESYEVKSDLSETESIKEEQVTYISEYMDKCIKALKAKDEDSAKEYMDIDSLVDIYIGNEIVKNVDAGWDSFYMYKDAGGKLCFGPMWDFDIALGNADCVKGFDSWKGFNPYTILNVNANSNPWFCYALSCKWFRELVKERYNELQDKINNLSNTVIEEAEANYNSYCRNFEKWDVLGRQVNIEPTEISELNTFKEHYMYLSNWIKNRTEWLMNYYNTDDFINGIFVDENGEVLSADSNIIANSTIMAYAIPPSEITYEMTDNTGIILNIKKGGLANWSIQALASGFMLEKGAEYELSFDYSCSKECSTSFSIQENHDQYASYISDKLDMTGTMKHYDTTFTAAANDTNCAFAISLGNSIFEGTVVTIDNMCLVKKQNSSSDTLLSAKLNVISDWGSGAVCNIIVTNNTGKDLTNGWTLDFDLNRNITNLWGANLQKNINDHYTVTNPAWKTTLANGESYTLGFQVDYGIGFDISNIDFGV